MRGLFHDLRFAARSLRQRWLFSLLAITSLGLAIGGNAVVFSIFDAIMFRSLPYEGVDSMLWLWQSRKGQPEDLALLSPAEFLDYRERAATLGEMAAFGALPVNLTGSDKPEQIVAEAVSANLFEFLGVRANWGRVFSPEESLPGSDRVVILSHEFWAERYGADPQILGGTVLLDSEPHVIIGVMRSDFAIFSTRAELWIPLIENRHKPARGSRSLFVFARLAPGSTLPQAQAEIQAIASRLELEYENHSRGYDGRLDLFQNRFPNPRGVQIFTLLQGSVIFVLLIACANIANLLLVRGHARRKELALRAALGAGTHRVVRLLLLESLLLAMLGGGLGLALAAAGVEITYAGLAHLTPRRFLPQLDFKVLGLTLGLTFLASLFSGLAPALRCRRIDLVHTLKEGGRGAGPTASKRFFSRGLVVAEVAMALVLLAGAGVLIQSFSDLHEVDPGLPVESLLTMQISLPAVKYGRDEQISRFFETAIERLQGIPGVVNATVANNLPRNPFAVSASYYPQEDPPEEDRPLPLAFSLQVAPGYLKTMGIGLQQGRAFEESDRSSAPPVAVISRELARRVWGDEDALGRELHFQGVPRTVVGIVDNVLQGWVIGELGPQAAVYLPQGQAPLPIMFFVLRTRADPLQFAEAARREIESLDPDLTIGSVLSLEQYIDQFFVATRIFSLILGLFGLLGLSLASLGIYSVLAYSVAQRRHEIGVRIALGAHRRNVMRLVTRRGLALSLIGLALGLPGSLVVTRLIQSTLSGIARVETGPVIGAGLVLLLVSLLASYLPARRAASFDPVDSLRGKS